MKRSPIPLLVLLLLTWSVANYLWFDAWNQRSEKLRKSVDAFESVESDFDEYSALKIAPPLPEELANSLAEFRSEKASDYLREAFADIDCVLVTKPVYEGGVLFREVTGKFVLVPNLSDVGPGRYYEVGHRIPVVEPRPREVGFWVVLRHNGESFFPVTNGRIKGLAHIPEEFALRELRKMAALAQKEDNS